MLFYCGNQWGYTPVGVILNIPTGYCNPPLDLKATVYAQYATLSWQAPHDYLKFILEYRIVGSPTWTTLPVFGQSVVLTLTALTQYEWRVKTVCEETPTLRESVYANGPNFLTGASVAGCTAVTAVQLIYLGDRYRLEWADTSAAYYTVEIKLASVQTGRTYTTQDTFFEISSLTVGEVYEARVIAHCYNVTMTPMPSPWVTWTVANLNCPPPGKINSTKGATSIVIGWASAGIGYKYNIYLNNLPVIINFPGTTWTFNGLTPNTTYNIKVATNCGDGLSPAQNVDIKTDPVPCLPPVELRVVTASITPTGFDIAWTPALGIVSQQVILNNGTPIPLGAAIATYSFTGLTPGSNNTVVVRSVCTANVSPDATVSQQLTGCPPVTNLVVTGNAQSIGATWNPVANAVSYTVTINKLTAPTGTITFNVTNSNFGHASSLIQPTSNYEVIVVVNCAGGTTSTPVTGLFTTPAKPACESAIIDTQKVMSTTIDILTWHFASGITTGFFEYRLQRVSDLVYVALGQIQAIQPINFINLTPNTAYKVYIFDRTGPSSNLPCVPTEIVTITTPISCAPPTNVSAVMVDPAGTSILVTITPSVDNPPTYTVGYRWADFPAWSFQNSIPAASFPFTITPVTPGKYEVQVYSQCATSNSVPVFVWACPRPVITVKNSITGGIHLEWGALAGIHRYEVFLTAQATGTVLTYSSTINSIDITDLVPGAVYDGYVKAICDDDTNTGLDSLPFTESAGLDVPGRIDGCPDPIFTAYSQDCGVTDPGGIGGGGGSGPVDPGGGGGGVGADCSVTQQDWTLVNALFADVSDDAPNDTFLEATFEIAQSLGNGVLAAMPGGIMGIINASCLPASTANVGLEVVLGGSLEVGNGTYATNGNITVAASYTSDGSSRLVVRLRGNYNKV